MRYPPDDEHEREKEMRGYAAEPWMMDQLDRNWSYLGWGPHEDYQWIDDLSHPNSPRKVASWSAFRKGFTVGEYPDARDDRSGGEIVGWYFNLARERKECKACEGHGSNPETKRIEEDWYDFARTGRRWDNKITQDEADALLEAGRLNSMIYAYTRTELDALVEKGRVTAERADELWENRDKSKDYEVQHSDGISSHVRNGVKWRDSVPVEEVNATGGHDAINRWICVRTRAKRLGVYGHCEQCNGDGYLPVDLKGRLQLVLWIINPLTGQSYGFEIDNIEKTELEAVHDFLQGMRDRLVSRLDMPEATTSKDLKGFCSGETMMWTQAGSFLERSDAGWASEYICPSWKDFCWPTHWTYGDRKNGDRVPEDHPKFKELWTGEPNWGLDDLNELVSIRFGFDPHGQKVERLYLWMILPRKGASKRITINSITEEDLPGIRRYAQQAVERARERLDPAPGE